MNATLAQRLESLSPAKRILLEKKLKIKAIASPKDAFSSKETFSISRRQNSGVAPLSFNQESLHFMERLNPDTSTYNLYEAIRLTGNLNAAALQKTLDYIVARHESLRTSFREIDGRPLQIIAAPQSLPIQILDFSSSPEAERERLALEKLNTEVNRPMDLQNGLLIEAMLVKLAPEQHFFLVKMHHIISDGWSMGVFWKEFTHLYQSFSQGEIPALPELPIQFGDYAIWSREQLKREETRQIEFWKNRLKDAPALLELPTDRMRPAVQSSRGAQQISLFPAKLHDGLKKLSRREGATLFMTLLAAFDVLLVRYTGQEDLIVGSPVAGRSRTETENLIGFFVNTLALRGDLSGDPTFRQLLGQIRNTTLDAFSHQDLPFEKVVAAVCPERSLSYNPIFQVAFALQPNSESLLKMSELEVQPVKLGSVSSKFDLFLSAKETPDGLSVTAEYSTDLFDAATVERLLSHYRNLLEDSIANPDRRVSELQLLGKSERRQLLVDWNDTATDFPNQTLQQLFEAQAARQAEAIAVQSPEENLTYERLNRQANQIAHYLRKKGVSANAPVGIFMNRSALMVSGILGTLKAGGAYLPLDSASPQTRLRQMIEDAQVKVILTVAEKVSQLPATEAEVICLDAEAEIFAAESAENPANINQPTDLAYVIYTSGSTGEPKGTLIPHRAVNRLVFNTNYIQIASTDCIAHVSNVSFDAATFELWGALLHGARLVVLDKDLVLSPKEFASELKAKKISAMFLTTSLFNLMSASEPGAFETLKTLIVGGEALDPTAVRRVLENNPPERLVNGYGPTETTTFAICNEIKTVAPNALSIPLGRPISNTTVYILDSRQNPVPVGVSGEIYIGGDGLALGYLNRPGLTAEKFVSLSSNKLGACFADSDVGENQTVRLYRTGDIGRRLPDGCIEFLGRRDDQIKLRGFRIELGEIESAVNAHPSVKEAVVAVKENGGEKKIVAYFVRAEECALTLNELREFLKQRLPDYMIPAIFLEVAELALTPNGKIDRKQLPALEETSIEASKIIAVPKDELEIKLALIFQQVLGLGSIGVNDNFFECGGHSLKAVRLFSEIEKALHCHLPLAALFQAPTVELLAELIRAGGWKSEWQAIVPLRSPGSKPPFFCIHAVGGNILEYKDLAAHLDSDQPFYGLQSLGLDGKSAPLDDIDEMAAAYLKEIRQIQPEGPYYLGGRSFGGTVAYEMARILVEQGETVALLAILDSYPKGWMKLCTEEEAQGYKKQFLKLRIKRHLENGKQLGVFGKVKYLLEKANYKKRKYKSLLWRLRRKQNAVEPGKSVAATIRNIEEINYLAIKKYVPKLYPGTVTFFSAREEVVPEENLTGWRRLAQGGVEVVEVAGDHQTMIKEPFVETLAEALENSINRSINNKS